MLFFLHVVAAFICCSVSQSSVFFDSPTVSCIALPLCIQSLAAYLIMNPCVLGRFGQTSYIVLINYNLAPAKFPPLLKVSPYVVQPYFSHHNFPTIS